MALHLLGFLPIHFPTGLIQRHQAANLTQQSLSEMTELHVNQICRYVAGTVQTTIEALIRLVKAPRDGMLLKHQARRLAGAAV